MLTFIYLDIPFEHQNFSRIYNPNTEKFVAVKIQEDYKEDLDILFKKCISRLRDLQLNSKDKKPKLASNKIQAGKSKSKNNAQNNQIEEEEDLAIF